jgi:argininosuccinate synthase
MEKSSELNDLANYPQLMERSKKIGYEISKMVYRGYHAHPELQRIHDSSIQTRTKLKLAVSISDLHEGQASCISDSHQASCKYLKLKLTIIFNSDPHQAHYKLITS